MVDLTSAPLPPLAGSPGLVQGSYGDAGNLELAVPAADSGIWIFWFNADPVDHRAGAAIRCWSGGLHVFAGHRVQAARISQLRAGPNYLELLALSDARLHRLYWTPEDGFVDAGVIATDIASTSPVHEGKDALRIDVRTLDGAARRLIGNMDRYPSVAWTTAADDDPIEARPTVPAGLPDVAYDDLAWAETTLDGGRIDVVLRTGRELFHVHGRSSAWSEPERIVSRVWLPANSPVHRP
jgi:hypothetical protein